MNMQSETTEKQEAMPVRLLAEKVDGIASGQTRLEVALTRLESSMMPRHEIQAADDLRVLNSVYLADQASIRQQLAEVKNAPQALWVKLGIIASAGIGCIGLLISATSAIIALLVAAGVIK